MHIKQSLPWLSKEPFHCGGTKRIFCVGFHKTGTTSMKTLLEHFGYRVHGAYKTRDEDFVKRLSVGDLDELYAEAEHYDAFQDSPWFLFYRELSARYSGSRFILTIRDKDAWIRSVVEHFGNQKIPDSPMRRLIYGHGSPVGHEEAYMDCYQRHNKEVQEFFRDRTSELLVVDLSRPRAAQRIGDFLGHWCPPWKRMPHRNKGSYRG